MGGTKSDGHIFFFVDVFLSFAATICWSCGPMPSPWIIFGDGRNPVQSQIWKRWAVTSFNMKCKTQRCQQIFSMSAVFFLDVNLRKHTFNTRPTRELHHLAHPIPKQIPCAKAFQKKLQEVTEERALGPCLTQSFRLESSPWQGNGDLWIIKLILLEEWSLTWN